MAEKNNVVKSNSEEEYFTDSENTTSVKELEKKCLSLQPKYRVMDRRVTRSNSKLADGKDNILANKSNKQLKNIVGDALDDIQEDMGSVKSSMEKLTLKMNKLSNIMTVVANRVDDLESALNDHDEKLEQNAKEIGMLNNETDEIRREICNLKLILNYDKVNTNSPTFVTEIKNFLLNEMNVSATIVDSLGIFKFGKNNCMAVLQLVSIAHKKEILIAKKNLLSDEDQGNNYDGLFINEFLTPKNAVLMKMARQLKKAKKLHTVYSLNGIVYVKKKAEDNGIRIRCSDDLDRF